MIEEFHIQGYRSLVDFRMALGRVTVVRGANGMGKSNLYKSLQLLGALAEGNFAAAVASEGGMASLLWAGNEDFRRNTVIRASVVHSAFTYQLSCGLKDVLREESAFFLDPDIKTEELRAPGRRGKVVARRKKETFRAASINGTNIDGRTLHGTTSMLSELRDPENFPFLVLAREAFADWRFYEEFRTDAGAPARQPAPGYWSRVLAPDAANLASTIQTILESGGGGAFAQAVDMAFPGCEVDIHVDGDFRTTFATPSLPRRLDARELSDGTLRFLCLAAALCSVQPPGLLVLNEPETSLNDQVLHALAALIAHAACRTQILVVTHSETLTDFLRQETDCIVHALAMRKGETRLSDQVGSRKVYYTAKDEEA